MIDFVDKSEHLKEDELNTLIQNAIAKGEDVRFSNVSFDIQHIDARKGLKNLSFEKCCFQKGIKISNITDGGTVAIIGCSFVNDIGIYFKDLKLTSIQVVDNNVLKKTENNASDDLFLNENGIISETIYFENVTICYITINSTNCHIELKNVYLLDRLKAIGLGDKFEPRDVAFRECFVNDARLTFRNCRLGYFGFNYCREYDFPEKKHHTKTSNPLKSHVKFVFSKLKRVEIRETSCPHLNFSFENTPLKEYLEIYDSNVGFLDLSMSVDFDDGNKLIHNFNVIDSSIGWVSFVGRVFDFPLVFRNTIFFGAPIFHGVQIPQGSHFPVIENFKEKKGVETIKAYRTLRLSMEEQRARGDEGLFYALEQETILNTLHRKTKYISLNFWYKLTSQYGTSYKRPLILILIAFIFFSIIYALLLSPVIGIQHTIDWGIIEKATVFSLKQMLLPFYSLRDLAPTDLDSSEAHLLIRCVSSFQSLVSLSLFSVAIFAIRWKFKRG